MTRLMLFCLPAAIALFAAATTHAAIATPAANRPSCGCFGRDFATKQLHSRQESQTSTREV